MASGGGRSGPFGSATASPQEGRPDAHQEEDGGQTPPNSSQATPPIERWQRIREWRPARSVAGELETTQERQMDADQIEDETELRQQRQPRLKIDFATIHGHPQITMWFCIVRVFAKVHNQVAESSKILLSSCDRLKG